MLLEETSPLLGDHDSEYRPRSNSRFSHSSSPFLKQSTGKSNNVSLLLIMGLLIFMIDFGSYLALYAQTAIFEEIICDDFYGRPGYGTITNGTIGDGRCKIEPVQAELALLNGWEETFSNIPGNYMGIILLVKACNRLF
jgi:hypothetical protein